jgi:hypothetical protein
MEPKTRTGYLLLADISGYTVFLAETEIEHAHLAISYLLEAIVGTLGGVLTLVKLEGDAVFAYVDERQLPDNISLLDLIDQTYLAFRDLAESLHRGATCECKACKAIPNLDLKFMIHHGDFIIQQIAGIKDLLGSDVNLVHRLAKNRVADATGWRGYALFTQQGLERLQADKTAFLQQHQSYEHFGEVETYVIDLHHRYKAAKSS